MTRLFTSSLLVAAFGLMFLAVACDSDISGDRLENQPPETHLSVRDSSLVENLASDERLSSTVFVSWTGDDPDGFVSLFEFRFFSSADLPGKEDLWQPTTDSDTLVLLPIPPGDKEADVVFEVRAIDNEGARDPTPAKTIYPIKNSPPSISLSAFEAPVDTTFAIFSFAWRVSDPEGPENLDRIDLSLNDSLSFVGVPADIDFVTFVGEIDKNDPGQTEADAKLFFGRAFQTSGITVPGLRLGADNTLYVRAADKTDTTSAIESYSWHVKKSRSDILYVNDYRRSIFRTVQRFHVALLRDYLPVGTDIDLWDISVPFASGAAGNTPRSPLMPTTPDPTLSQALADYSFIYWVSTNVTASSAGDNLAFVAGTLNLFFERGGKMMIHSPIALPADPEDILGNPVLLLLPMSGLVSFPDSLRPALNMSNGAAISPAIDVPGLGQPLPALEADAFFLNALPFDASGLGVVPLASGEYTYITRTGNRTGPWFGPATMASISDDRRVGLFALPLVNEQSGEQTLIGADGNVDAPIQAIHMILESLGFPR